MLELASVLRNTTPIVFVGESAGDGPNRVGDNIEMGFDLAGLDFCGTGARGKRMGSKPVGKVTLHTPS